MHKQLWSRHDVKLETKLKVYNTAFISSLLYSTEALIFHARQLTVVQTRHLRYLLGITWQDKLPDTKVMETAMSVSVEAKITAAHLRWAGHLHRMPEQSMPQQIMYCELCEGNRKKGRQKGSSKQNFT